MPRKIKNSKHIVQKKEIRKRLMGISVTVEKYFYRNKQITVSEAQMYLEELTSFESLCLGDAPSKQVCEKLTRCLKGIIEEQQSNNPMYEDTETFMEQSYSFNLNAPSSPVYSLPDDDRQMLSQIIIPDIHPENNDCNYNYSNNKNNEGDTENVDCPKKTVRFRTEDNVQNNKARISTGRASSEFNDVPTNICNTNLCIDNELTDAIVDLTLKEVENPGITDEDMCSQSLLKNLVITDTVQTVNIEVNCTNETCGQNMEEFDREIIHIVEPKHKFNKYNKPKATHEMKQSMTETLTITQDDKVQNKSVIIDKQTDCYDNIEKYKSKVKNKPAKEAKVQKKKNKKKNKENNSQAKCKTKRINTDNSTNNTNTTLRNQSETMDKVLTDNILETAVQYDLNFTEIPGSQNNSSIIQNTEKDISVSRSKLMCIEDLSWVENLSYVREIHVEEYDSTLKPYSESFWGNCELPHNWDSRDFDET